MRVSIDVRVQDNYKYDYLGTSEATIKVEDEALALLPRRDICTGLVEAAIKKAYETLATETLVEAAEEKA